MKKVIGIASVLLAASAANAADINCGGRVSLVMADHPSCNGHVAFKTEGTGGNVGIWMCTKSKEASAMVMAALLADKALSAYIEAADAGNVCTQLTHYRQVSYVILHP